VDIAGLSAVSSAEQLAVAVYWERLAWSWIKRNMLRYNDALGDYLLLNS
jgi:hypothetical protein